MSNSHPSINDANPLNAGGQNPAPIISSTQEMGVSAQEIKVIDDKNSEPQKDLSKSKTEGRYLFVDAIRGIAAVCVVMRHIYYSDYSGHGAALNQIFPEFLRTLHIWGAAGVYAFFVLSGFVITHSLRKNSLQSKAVWNFILRRQIRLDPVYWAVLAIFLSVTFGRMLMGQPHGKLLSIGDILANMFYVQYLLRMDKILGPAWTLCIEIQFYLTFIGLLLLGRKAPRLHPSFNITNISMFGVLGLGVISLIANHVFFIPVIFTSFWHYFALGALAYWAMQRAISPKIFFAYTALFALDTLLADPGKITDFGARHALASQSMIVGLITATSLYYAGTHGYMGKWGKQPVFQYLGKISYSLYLVHMLVIDNLPQYFFPAAKSNPSIALAWYISTFALSIIGAHLLYICIEKPSMKFGSRLKIASA